MVTKTGLKTTAVQTPSDDNHTTVLRQLKEVAEVGQRLRGDPSDSFVRVSELTNAGIMRLVNGTLQPPTSQSLPGAVVPSTRSVLTAGSLVGGGTLAADLTLQLDGDTGSPGNSKFYGTNSSGTKGWYSSVGSTTLSALTDVAISSPSNGQVLTYDSGTSKWKNAAGGGGTTGVPGTIPDLQYWFSAAPILAAAGGAVYILQNSCPWQLGLNATPSAGGATISSTQLNSLNVITFPGSSTGRYNLPTGLLLAKTTIFAVFKPASLPTQAFTCGGSSSLEFRIETSGKLGLIQTQVAGIATGTGALSAGTWYQVNATYNSSTGAWAFRIAQAADSSGTNAKSITSANAGIGYNPATGNEDLAGDLAEMIIYTRVLSPTEITSVEAYLHTKWGV